VQLVGRESRETNFGSRSGEFRYQPVGSIDGISQAARTRRLTLGAASATTNSFEAGQAPVEIESGEQSLGTIAPGNSRQASLTLEVDDDTQPGTYDIPATTTYTYIHTIVVDRDDYIVDRNTQIVSEDVTVRLEKDGDWTSSRWAAKGSTRTPRSR